jgi:glycosyltransferase involved in cell wall biosynthesis
MVKLVHIQKHLPSSGNAAYRLHNVFIDAGYESSMLSLSSDISGDDKICRLNKLYQAMPFIDGKILQFLTRKAEKNYGLFSFPVLGVDISKNEKIQKADIIYIHWINGGFLNFRSIKRLAKLNKPVVFIMHDMWTITGGCHHSFTCEKYLTGCNHCPIFPRMKFNDLSRIEFIRKNRLYQRFENFFFVAPSKWLYECARNSNLTFNKPVFHIPNVIDQNFFKSFNKATAKQLLSIGNDYKVISFGAISINSPYKGFVYLREALDILSKKLTEDKILVLIFGESSMTQFLDVPFPVKLMGRLHDELSMVIAYNASDVFIAPSLADNLPTTVMESLCCGTPVVGFDIGGIPDMVEHKKNGYLARYRDSDDLAEGIVYCLNNRINASLNPIFEPSSIIGMHEDLIKTILRS